MVKWALLQLRRDGISLLGCEQDENTWFPPHSWYTWVEIGQQHANIGNNFDTNNGGGFMLGWTSNLNLCIEMNSGREFTKILISTVRVGIREESCRLWIRRISTTFTAELFYSILCRSWVGISVSTSRIAPNRYNILFGINAFKLGLLLTLRRNELAAVQVEKVALILFLTK